MIDPLFFICITISFISFGIQMPLMVKYVRLHDGIVVTTIRNLSLIVTMLPFLLFASTAEIIAVFPYLPQIMFASFLGTLSFIAALNASKYIPVGITYATRQVIYVSLTLALGYLFMNEVLSTTQVVLLLTIITLGVALSFTKSTHAHLKPEDARKGIALALFAGTFHAGTFFFFTEVARAVNPLVASYFWEVFVGVFALCIYGAKRYFTSYTQPLLIHQRDMRHLVLIGLLTLSGTGGYSIAVNYGPFALATGLVTLSTVVAMLVAWTVFGERLSKIQVLLILTIVAALIAIKVVS